MSSTLPVRPPDATLSVTKAARVLGVHPNTVRAWSDAGRLRYYRINPRGDRRYRPLDLQRFLSAAESHPLPHDGTGGMGGPSRRQFDPLAVASALAVGRGGSPSDADHRRDLGLLERIARIGVGRGDLDEALERVASTIVAGLDLALVAIWESREDRLSVRASASRRPADAAAARPAARVRDPRASAGRRPPHG